MSSQGALESESGVYLGVIVLKFSHCFGAIVFLLFIVSSLFVDMNVPCSTSLVNVTGFYTDGEPESGSEIFCCQILQTTAQDISIKHDFRGSTPL